MLCCLCVQALLWEHNVGGMFSVLQPLHVKMEKGPETLKEISFNHVRHPHTLTPSHPHSGVQTGPSRGLRLVQEIPGTRTLTPSHPHPPHRHPLTPPHPPPGDHQRKGPHSSLGAVLPHKASWELPTHIQTTAPGKTTMVTG